MYFQEDTVLRMIEMLGAAFRRLIQMLNDMEADAALGEAYKQFIGMDRTTAEGISTEALIDMVGPDRRMALCELLVMETTRFAHRFDEDELQRMRHRALLLLCSIEDEEIARLRADRARELLDGCFELCESRETLMIVRFFLLGGAYAQAEDALFAQMGAFSRAEDWRCVAQAGDWLYAALAAVPDEKLLAGNLPREEVAQGHEALTSWAAAHGVPMYGEGAS